MPHNIPLKIGKFKEIPPTQEARRRYHKKNTKTLLMGFIRKRGQKKDT